MSLDIKNERVHALAREAAQRSGLGQTSVIERALVDFLASLDTDDSTAATAHEEWRRRVDTTLAEIDACLTDESRALLTTDDLYDEDRLPA